MCRCATQARSACQMARHAHLEIVAMVWAPARGLQGDFMDEIAEFICKEWREVRQRCAKAIANGPAYVPLERLGTGPCR